MGFVSPFKLVLDSCEFQLKPKCIARVLCVCIRSNQVIWPRMHRRFAARPKSKWHLVVALLVVYSLYMCFISVTSCLKLSCGKIAVRISIALFLIPMRPPPTSGVREDYKHRAVQIWTEHILAAAELGSASVITL